MKAIIWTKYGPPEGLQLQEIDKPTPKDNEVLIKVHATTVTAGDCEMRSLKVPLGLGIPMRLYNGLRKPKKFTILGQELAGEIEAVGKDVTLFKQGDQVFAASGIFTTSGGYTEYVCMPEKPEEGMLALKPVNMSYEEAAAVPFGGFEALHFLRKANVQNGQKILIIGAGGTIGTFAVQIAKSFGTEVTAVDIGTKLDMLRSIGADNVIDYTQTDYTKTGDKYDVIFDVMGKGSKRGCLRSLNPRGIYVSSNPKVSMIFWAIWALLTSRKRVKTGTSSYTPESIIFLKKQIEAGKIKTVIDRRYPLEQMVDAHKYFETGQKKGNIIINVVPNE